MCNQYAGWPNWPTWEVFNWISDDHEILKSLEEVERVLRASALKEILLERMPLQENSLYSSLL